MSAKKTNISQIHKYLNGELDASAMHQLERDAQDDPFLMDALEGYEQAGKDQQANLTNLQERLADRIAPKKERSIFLWRVLPIAACLLIALTVGYWYFAPKPVKQYADLVKPDKITPPPAVPQQATPNIGAQQNKVPTKASNTAVLRQYPPVPATRQKVIYKTDTVDYNASAYKVRTNTTAEDLLKKVPGVAVDANGNVTSQGQAVTKVRINGKDFMGGDVKAATKNLPADIIEKIQVVDDYGDQAAKTGVKSGDPTKVLNITMDTTLKLIASNKHPPAGSVMIRGNRSAANELKEVSINDGRSNLKDTTLNQALSGRVAGVMTKNKTNNDAPRTITGKVVAKDDGAPLPGVTVRINGMRNGTQTDANGNFNIILPSSEAALNVGFVGYLTQKIEVGKQDNLKIELAPDNASLSEVVVVGYGSAKRSAVSYKAEHPLIGWIDYNKYLKENATITDDKPVTIQLMFSVSADGTVSNIQVIKGSTDELNQRAVKLIENGSKWIGSTDGKTKLVKLNIKFQKK